MDTVAVSVCIPAYRKPDQLIRLLESLLLQRFSNYEVIVSDDSPDNSVRIICEQYQHKLPLQYFHNQPALGSPENWNNAIRKAKGKWIKLMHDDDAFATPDSLGALYALTSGGADFVFSGYNVVEETSIRSSHHIAPSWVEKLNQDPRLLLSNNVIGHPSVTMHLNNGRLWYDKRMKWMVDIDFYVRCMQQGSFNYSTEPLINIGHHEAQITRSVFLDKKVVVPENMLLLHKLGEELLGNVQIYDYYWRLLRNYNIGSETELQQLSPVAVPEKIKKMLKFQRMFPQWLLKIGPVSKVLMVLSRMLNR
ncbi:glycosyltransferase [Pseudoflavitalea sp. G-6-1-2]|uniref:glycosyltransferase family 2 protein n=1 Tax=Pseudoflavitalea sp. G-6-1-2 TaxID=2728841 RepID=UPI00146ECF57|nr:glycosyltransferase [Pseudoflavitalea sp. G-6-1-2]NML21822.1 glycosyltransferase [Pseudoflavitalea sp. G-6-1-2]